MKEIKRSTIEVNSIKLSVLTAGPANGKPIIILHGFPEFAMSFKSQINFLAENGYFVIAPDQRGYNLSSHPKDISSYTIDVLGNDILALLDYFKIPKANILGHDWGAVVTWYLISYFPERFTKATIMSAPHSKIMRKNLTGNFKQCLKSWYIFFIQIPWLPEFLMKRDSFKSFKKNISLSCKNSIYNQTELDELHQMWVKDNSIKSMLDWYRAIVRFKPERMKGKIKVPVQLIWGKRDSFIGLELAEQSIALCKDGELKVFENTGHWPHRENTDEVNELLKSFF